MKMPGTLLGLMLLWLAVCGRVAASETVNINTADVATLDRVLVNVGPAKAQAIVAYRQANGAFRSAEQLALVKGIGLKTVERNRDRIIVGVPRRSVRPVWHPVAPAGQPARRPSAPNRVPRR